MQWDQGEHHGRHESCHERGRTRRCRGPYLTWSKIAFASVLTLAVGDEIARYPGAPGTTKRSGNPTVCICLLAVALSLALEGAQAAEWFLEGHVVGVSDGDTITVLDDAKTQHKVRFSGIDAPENGQAFAKESQRSLSALVFQKRVEARCHRRDRHGYQVCAVFVGLRDVGLAQIRAGMAWWYREYAHEQRMHEPILYRDEEESAKARRVGLWSDEKPAPPWEWRRSTTPRQATTN